MFLTMISQPLYNCHLEHAIHPLHLHSNIRAKSNNASSLNHLAVPFKPPSASHYLPDAVVTAQPPSQLHAGLPQVMAVGVGALMEGVQRVLWEVQRRWLCYEVSAVVGRTVVAGNKSGIFSLYLTKHRI